MNKRRMNSLLQWLEAGAPSYVFNMRVSRVGFDEHDLNDSFVLKQVEEKGLGSCGTMCCIGGWAAGKDKRYKGHHSWEVVGELALEYLGLPYIEDESTDDGWFFHPLFNPFLAPKNCTPAQAAQAVRNTIADPTCNPWIGVI